MLAPHCHPECAVTLSLSKSEFTKRYFILTRLRQAQADIQLIIIVHHLKVNKEPKGVTLSLSKVSP